MSKRTDYEPLNPARAADPDTAQAVAQRWETWKIQLRAGQEPCFRTGKRYQCGYRQCRWRAECRAVRAQWQL